MEYFNLDEKEIQREFDEAIAILSKVPTTMQLRRVYNRLKEFNIYSKDLQIELGRTIITCESCGEICFAKDSHGVYNCGWQVCDVCFQSKYSYCSGCGTYVLSFELNNASHTHDVLLLDGTVFAWNNGDEENAHVAAFDADIMSIKKTKTFCTKDELRQPERVRQLYGLELEVEKIKAGPFHLDKKAVNWLHQDFFMVKHDGSLSAKGRGGFEIVTMPATLAYHEDGAWRKFFDVLSPYFQYAPPTAALHVHFGTATIGDATIDKMANFVNNKQNLEFLASIAHRDLNTPNPNGKIYATMRDWKPGDLLRLKIHSPDCPWNPNNQYDNRYERTSTGSVLKDDWGHPIIGSLRPSALIKRAICRCQAGRYNLKDHYSAFNLLTKRPTAELRIFRGIVKEEFLYGALEFTSALISFCTDTSPNELSYPNFLEWIRDGRRRAYPNAVMLLQNRGWIEPAKSRLNLELGKRTTDADSNSAYSNGDVSEEQR